MRSVARTRSNSASSRSKWALFSRQRARASPPSRAPRAHRTPVRAVGQEEPGLLERLAQRRHPEADGPLGGQDVGHLPRGLGAHEAPAPRLHAGPGVGGLDTASGKAKAPGENRLSGWRWRSSTSKHPGASRARMTEAASRAAGGGRAARHVAGRITGSGAVNGAAGSVRGRPTSATGRMPGCAGSWRSSPRWSSSTRSSSPSSHRSCPPTHRARPVEGRRRRPRGRVCDRRLGGGTPERLAGLPAGSPANPPPRSRRDGGHERPLRARGASSASSWSRDSRPASAVRARGRRRSAGSRGRRLPSGAAS